MARARGPSGPCACQGASESFPQGFEYCDSGHISELKLWTCTWRPDQRGTGTCGLSPRSLHLHDHSRWWPESISAQNVFKSQMLKIHAKIYIHFSPFEYESPLSSLNTQLHKRRWLLLSIAPLLMPLAPIFPHLKSKGVKMILLKNDNIKQDSKIKEWITIAFGG